MNTTLLEGVGPNVSVVAWEDRDSVALEPYDLLINLEDDVGVAEFARSVQREQLFGAHVTEDGRMAYTEDARGWFDLSLISVYGRSKADALKYENRASYQQLIFAGLGWQFQGEPYLLPAPVPTDLKGDVAIAPVAGPVWPMKSWAYYTQLQEKLEAMGLRVNVLPRRPSLLEHYADVSQHRCLVCGDSLPMHFALAAGIQCVAIFNCTSPWEIYDYGLLTKVVSPLLGEHFYSRAFDPRATTAVSLDEVIAAVLARLDGTARAREVRR